MNPYRISASPRSCKEFSTFFTLLDSPDYISFSFGKLFSLLPTAFRMNKIPFPIPKFTFLALSYSVLAENLVKEVNKKIFHGLVNLKTLSLYSNHISCVTPGAFDALVSLQSLNLIANPFNCNCHMAWFADWLRTKGLTAGGPRCAFPLHLKDRPIHALPSHEFRCTGT